MSTTSANELEAMLSELETWRPAETEGDLAQERIDWLDKELTTLDPSSLIYSRSFRRFRALCRQTRRLPSACFLSKDIKIESQHPLHQTALSDVYRGAYGKVIVASKSLRVHGSDRAKVEKAFYDEVVTWRCLRHPNIVPFLGASTILPVCLVSEWMVFGDIASFLRDRPSENRMPYVKQILSGLSFLHSLDVVHGDLKAANILINAELKACLADFGLTTLLQSTGTITGTSSVRGTLRWMAPELLLADGAVPDAGKPSRASDMYAFSMVIWEIFTGRIPFDLIPSEYKILMDVSMGARPLQPEGAEEIGFNNTLWTVMERCWLPEPERRPSCLEVAEALTSLDEPHNPAALEHEILIGIYEIVDTKTGQALDLTIINERSTGTILMWERHGGDNQRWTIKKEDEGYIIAAIDNGDSYLSIGPDVAGYSTLVMSNVVTFWKFLPVSEMTPSFRITDLCEENTIAALPPAPGIQFAQAAVLPVGREDTEWSVVKELEPTVDLEGTFAVINVATERSLDMWTSSYGDIPLRVFANESLKHSKWEFKRTKRGHTICAEWGRGQYICLDGHKPPREGMGLASSGYPQTWRLERVERHAERGIFRIYWPDKSLAIGADLSVPGLRKWFGQTRDDKELVALYPASNLEKSPGLEWRLEPYRLNPRQ